MPDFRYSARTATGAIQKDVLTALNTKAAADALRAQGLTPTLIEPATKSIGSTDMTELLGFIRRIKLVDKITFIKNLGVMIRSSLPVSKSLKILAEQTPNQKFKKVLAEIARSVESGNSLSDSMGKYPKVFSQIFISMVRAGESSGTLEQNLSYLGEQMQRDYDLLSKTRSALTYPAVVVVAMIIVGFVMFTFVLPKLTATFTESGVALPATTQFVVFVVNIFAHYGILVLIGTFLLIFAFFYWKNTDSGRKVLHKVVLYTPVLSPIIVKINLARFTRTFASLIKSGMPIVEALDVSSHVVGNIYYQKIIAEAAAKVKIGSPLTAAFKRQPRLFSSLVVQMMEVGEESGTTDSVLNEVANFYESEVDQTMKNLSSILEPVIMMVIGVAVGFLAVSLISPIYNLTQTIN